MPDWAGRMSSASLRVLCGSASKILRLLFAKQLHYDGDSGGQKEFFDTAGLGGAGNSMPSKRLV